MNNEWITDRLPTEEDADSHGYVWITDKDGDVHHMMWDCVVEEPWMHLQSPEPYVKPKRFEVVDDKTEYYVNEKRGQVTWATVPVRDDDYDRAKEAAERIAAIYEEVMP